MPSTDRQHMLLFPLLRPSELNRSSFLPQHSQSKHVQQQLAQLCNNGPRHQLPIANTCFAAPLTSIMNGNYNQRVLMGPYGEFFDTVP